VPRSYRSAIPPQHLCRESLPAPAILQAVFPHLPGTTRRAPHTRVAAPNARDRASRAVARQECGGRCSPRAAGVRTWRQDAATLAPRQALPHQALRQKEMTSVSDQRKALKTRALYRSPLSSRFVSHTHDVVAALAAGRVEFERVAFGLADQRARDRRRDRDAAVLDIRFQVADDLIDDAIATVFVLQFDSRAEHHTPARTESRDVDDFGVRQAELQFLDAAFQEALLLARGVVFGVLAQIAVCARFRNGRDDAWTFDGFQPFQFGAQPVRAGFGHGCSFHAFNPSCNSCRLTTSPRPR